MMQPQPDRLYKTGFTLLEMAIVLLIISSLIGGGLMMFRASLDNTSTTVTEQKLKVLQQALLDYRRAYDRLPCPADITLTPSSANFGVEESSGGNCAGTNFDDALDTVGGMVPVKTLRLPDDAAIDSWGRKILYVLDKRAATSTPGALPFAVGATSSIPDISYNRLIVRNLTPQGAADKTFWSAFYVLVSHGPNGHGGYPRSSSSPISSGSTDVDELDNCSCDSSGVYTLFDKTLVQSMAVSATFDDIVVFATRVQLRTSAE